MKNTLLVLCFIILSLYSFGQTQAEMNEEAIQKYRKADKELSNCYDITWLFQN
jgi:ribosome biogenesis protein Tsr3